MSLTAGSTLQNGKYLIQATLYQGDFSITYVAMHALLGQTVIVQTLNESLREHPRFEQVRQQFLAEVRRHVSHPAESTVQIRDFFEESGKPFVVLEHIPGQTPMQLSDWLKVLSQAVLAPDTAPPAALNGLHAPQPDPPSGGEHRSEAAPVASPSPQPEANAPAGESGAALNGTADSLQAQTAAVTAPVESRPPVLPTLQPAPPVLYPPPAAAAVQPRSQRWLPIALALTAIASGCAGIGLGWSVRFQQPGDADPPALFSREQDFPPQTDWLGEDPYADQEEESYEDSTTEYFPDRSPIERREVREYSPEPQEAAAPRRRRTSIESDSPPPIAVTEEEPLPKPDPFAEAEPLPEPAAIEPAPEAVAPPDLAPPVKVAPPVIPTAEPPQPDSSAIVPEAIAQ